MAAGLKSESAWTVIANGKLRTLHDSCHSPLVRPRGGIPPHYPVLRAFRKLASSPRR